MQIEHVPIKRAAVSYDFLIRIIHWYQHSWITDHTALQCQYYAVSVSLKAVMWPFSGMF